ncbi:MAG: DUF4383 domain-containing protein [Bdellovibrionaceae bacterium]|nr:DUF4383 domain-containing protein [Pseudobdellovibrionaceae bacterium]
MNARKYALWGGIAMLAMGLISMIPNLVGSTEGLPTLLIETSYGRFLNLFPMNILNKVALMAFGIWGILVSQDSIRAMEGSITFSKTVFYVMGVLAILGLIPQTNTLFGYWPLFGGEIFVHAIFALLGGYVVFSKNVAISNTTGMA